MESRPLRCFVAVAEELNFARAAARLGISAPPLSRAIRKLETELGATLFERTTHDVRLTHAGTVLLADARVALEALDAAARRAQRAACLEPRLVLAVKADGDAGLLDTILEKYATEPSALPVTVRVSGWGEQPRLLRQGEADVALLYDPFDHTGLDTETGLVHRVARSRCSRCEGHPWDDQRREGHPCDIRHPGRRPLRTVNVRGHRASVAPPPCGGPPCPRRAGPMRRARPPG